MLHCATARATLASDGRTFSCMRRAVRVTPGGKGEGGDGGSPRGHPFGVIDSAPTARRRVGKDPVLTRRCWPATCVDCPPAAPPQSGWGIHRP